MTFGAPIWLWGLAALPLFLVLFFWNEHRRSQMLGKLVAARLASRLAGSVSVGKRRFRFLLLLLGFALLVVAFAQPRYGFTFEQSKRKGRDVLIAIDTSRSMLANDLAPNRLVRAKLAAQDLLAELKGDRVGLVAFAGTAFLQAPLTVDYGAVLSALNELDTEIIPEGGSNIAEMIRACREAFGKSESDNRALIVFSDGEELDTDGIKAAADLNGKVRIFTVGVGSPEGALIPLTNAGKGAGFVKDEGGQIVKSRLDEARLEKIAESTGGFYLRLQSGRPEMNHIVREGLAKMSEQDIDARLSRHPIERYQWPLSGALVLLAGSLLVGERRRRRAVLTRAAAVAVAALFPAAGFAKNSGVEAYEREDYSGAAREFSQQLKLQPKSPELHFNRGSAAYKTGNLDEALAAFSQAVTSPDPQLRTRAAYNIGNTLFQRGVGHAEKPAKIQEWKNALQHYEDALRTEPKNADAAHNRDVVRKLLEELEKEPPKQDEQKKDEQKKKDQEQQPKDQEKNKEQQSDPQSGEGQKDEQQKENGTDQKQQPQEGSEKQDESGKSPKSSEAKDGKEPQDQDPKDGKAGEKPDPANPEQKKEAGKKPGEQEQNAGDPKKEKADHSERGKKPEPASPQPGEKKEGELKAAPGAAGDGQEEPPSEEATEAAAAANGTMTEKQAKALLESLRSEDEKVRLVDPEKRKAPARHLKNW